MNPDANNPADQRGDIADALRQLRPARAGIDASAIFYQAGFNAGQTERPGHRLGLSHIVATLIAMVIAAPVGYMTALQTPRQGGSIATAAGSGQELQAVDPKQTQPMPKQTEPTPQVKLAEIDAAKPAVVATFAPSGLFDFWSRQVSVARGRSEREHGATLLAAFHVSSNRIGSEWPDFFISSDALVHRDPEVTAIPEANSPAKIFAASDVRALAESFDVVQ